MGRMRRALVKLFKVGAVQQQLRQGELERLRAQHGATYRLLKIRRGKLDNTVDTFNAIECFVCGMVSYHPKDIEEKFCGCCHEFHSTMTRNNTPTNVLP